MKPQTEVDQIIDSVLDDICPPVVGASDAYRAARYSRRNKAVSYCMNFSDTMQGNAPFATEDEAIQALAPVAVWFIGWAARQFAIFVIKSLWRRWHAE